MSIFSHNFSCQFMHQTVIVMKTIASQRMNLNVNTISRQKIMQLTGAQCQRQRSIALVFANYTPLSETAPRWHDIIIVMIQNNDSLYALFKIFFK